MAKSKPIVSAPLRTWSPAALKAALKVAHAGDRTAAMKASGVLTKSGKLSKRYRSWGKDKVSVTETNTK
ncbi:MAG TPA: hypothetical protein VGN72_10240 [Tepidisphaeraceae bacterium]|jgi:hypothetical protein|nr:hypothetical protein [Tepidisphaeraceae bacterium]